MWPVSFLIFEFCLQVSPMKNKSMKKLCFFFLLTAALGSQCLFAQSKAVIQDYIEKFKDIAITEMARTGVPASITLAQGIHETAAGTSQLVVKSNNHFG
jgi:hypothetical protein